MLRQDNSTNASYRQRVSLPSAVSRQSRDSTYKFQRVTFRLFTSFLKFESHNKIIFVAAVSLFFLSIGFVNAEEKQNNDVWKPGAAAT